MAPRADLPIGLSAAQNRVICVRPPLLYAHVRTTSEGVRSSSGPSARPHWARMRRWSTVVPNPSRCRIADNRLLEDPRQNLREAVSDQGSGVRRRAETPTRAPWEKGTTIMKLATMTQVTVDGVMQGNGPTDVDHGNGFERGGWAMG